jgi:two-component sensor histidine kinase
MRSFLKQVPVPGILASFCLFLGGAAFHHRRTERRFRTLLAEKDILLRELAHRTKNNMLAIESLLSLQAAESTDERFAGIVSDLQDRIHAMALVHEMLYRSGSFDSVSLRDYLEDLTAALLRTRQGSGEAVLMNTELADVRVPVKEALSCGLIINELVSNSLKHAFPGGKGGTIFLALCRTGEKTEIRYRDDGPGMPETLDVSQTKTLGMKLVYNIAVKQLRGNIVLRRDPEPGFVLTFGGPPDFNPGKKPQNIFELEIGSPRSSERSR